MSSKSVNYLLTAATLFSSGVFCSSIPAEAHSFDYCIDLLLEEAEITVTGTSVNKLKQKYPKDYQAFSQDCEQELKQEGFLTLSQVKENKELANFARNGKVSLDSIDPVRVRKQKQDLEQSEARLAQRRLQICAETDPTTDYACRPQQRQDQLEKQQNLDFQSATPRTDNVLVAALPQASDILSQWTSNALKPISPLVSLIRENWEDRTGTPSNSPASANLVAQTDGSTGATDGTWEPAFNWPLVAVHMAVLPDGNVLAWTRPKLVTRQNSPKYILWNPVTRLFTQLASSISTDIFCAGHDFAPSGNLLLAGGHEGAPDFNPNQPAGLGSNDINVFNFTSKRWFSYPDGMPLGRWYSTVTYNGNGEGVIVGGSTGNETDKFNSVPEVWGRGGRASTDLLEKASSASFVHTSEGKGFNGLPVKPYLWNFLAPSGRIFNAGPTQTTRVLNTNGQGQWISISDNGLGNRYYGTAVMYDDGKVLIIGGSPDFNGPPTNTSETIDLSQGSPPRWVRTENNMQFPRRHHTATLLADGKVFVAGGTTCNGFNITIAGCPGVPTTNQSDRFGAVFAGEIWDPATNLWDTVASPNSKIKRSYHTTAVLLPDARVLVAGGGLPAGNASKKDDPTNTQGNFNAEIYSPPYLDPSKGLRPVITDAPDEGIKYGQPFLVQTPDAASITKVHLIRLSSMTHQFNMGQRINRLGFTAGTGNLNITAPSNKNLTPPGFYMLFILNDKGVPSVADIIRIS